MKFRHLYHVTSKEYAEEIVRTGIFDTELCPSPDSHNPHPEHKSQRICLCRREFIFKWIKILSREQHWRKLAILEFLIPEKLYRSWKWSFEKPEGFMGECDGEIDLDIYRPLKNGDLGIHFRINLRSALSETLKRN